MENPVYCRPLTRGELVQKLQQNVPCEVVTGNVEITSLMLKWWLNFEAYKVRVSEHAGWSVFEPLSQGTKA